MPTLTRSQARSGQPSDRVTSPRDHHTPRRVVESQQGNAVVVDTLEEGSPSTSTANGNQQSAGFEIIKCKSKRCLTCPKLNIFHNFSSNVTKYTYSVINHSNENISCHAHKI